MGADVDRLGAQGGELGEQLLAVLHVGVVRLVVAEEPPDRLHLALVLEASMRMVTGNESPAGGFWPNEGVDPEPDRRNGCYQGTEAERVHHGHPSGPASHPPEGGGTRSSCRWTVVRIVA